jgi:adenosylmethionine---8-amino-7-oxononanoate aminotransferase
MNKNILERDIKLIWHPFTQHKLAVAPIAITKAKGSYIYDESGKKYLDLISSWWVNLHGHCHPKISDAIYEQSKNLDHVMFAGLTHEPAIKLAESIKKVLPDHLKRFFYSDNGSTSTEIALKMAYQYWVNNGFEEKTLFLCFDGAYHGDTFGAMSVGKGSGYHNSFGKLLFDTLMIPYPATYINDSEIEEKEAYSLSILDEYLSLYESKISAFILEPIVQGASGMRYARPEFLNKILLKIKEKNIIIIFDEVMTGFGRLGTYFATDQLAVKPDIICMSKGISGGSLPLALTITTDQIFDGFLHDEWKYTFAHGHSYTANPIACAAGIASLEILLQDNTQHSIQKISNAHIDGCKLIQNKVSKIRHVGTIAAFEHANSLSISEKLIQKGYLIRPIRNVIYIIPPYSTTSDEIIEFYNIINHIL